MNKRICFRFVAITFQRNNFANSQLQKQSLIELDSLCSQLRDSDFCAKKMERNWTLIFLLVLSGTGSSESASSYSGRGERLESTGRLVPLVPQQSCYYESYNKRLACVCKSMDMDASLDLKLAYFAHTSGNEIREVQLRQCRRLAIRLDFTGVDSTNFPIHFNAIEQLDIEYISFEPLYQVKVQFNLCQLVIYRCKTDDFKITNFGLFPSINSNFRFL